MQGPPSNYMVMREGFVVPVFRVIGMGIFFVLIDGIFVMNMSVDRIKGGFFIAIQLVELFVIVYILLKWFYQYYEISHDGIVYKKGILFSSKKIYAFKNIESVKLKQGILGKLFNLGTISIYLPVLKKNLHMYFIPRPDECLSTLEKMLSPQDKLIISE